jgi:hypothetical protein
MNSVGSWSNELAAQLMESASSLMSYSLSTHLLVKRPLKSSMGKI